MKKGQFNPYWEHSGENERIEAASEVTIPNIDAVTAPRLRALPLSVNLSHVTQRTREMQFLVDKQDFMDLLEKDFHSYDVNHMSEFWSNGKPEYGVNFDWKVRENCYCFGCLVYRQIREMVDEGDTANRMNLVLAVTGVSIIVGKDIIAEGKKK